MMKPGLLGAAVAAMSTSVMSFGEPFPDVRHRQIPLSSSGRPQKDRTKIKAARKQNVQRQIQAKAARRGR